MEFSKFVSYEEGNHVYFNISYNSVR